MKNEEYSTSERIKKFLRRASTKLIFVGTLFAVVTIYFLLPNTISTDNAYVKSTKVQIVSEVSGFINEIFVPDNSRVSKNDKLLKIDDTNLIFEYKKVLEELALTEKKLIRHKKLNDGKFVPTREFEDSQTAYKLNLIKKAELEYKISNTLITSPIDGIVTQQVLEPGQYIVAHKPLFFVVNADSVWIKANFKETQIEKIKPGQKANVKVDSYPNLVFKGEVDTISPAAGSEFSALPIDMSYGNFVKIVQRIPVKIRVQNTDNLLKPGMSATVNIHSK